MHVVPDITLFTLLLVSQVPAPDQPRPDAAPLLADRAAILEKEQAELTAIADSLAKAGDGAAAAGVRALLNEEAYRADTVAQRFVPLPEVTTRARAGLASLPEASLAESAQTLRRESAAALFSLALDAASRGTERYALADQLLREVITRDPDHAEARRLLGFIPHEGGWATPFAAAQVAAGKVLHEIYGWVPRSWVVHLEKGELPGTAFEGDEPKEWLPAAQADSLRAKFHERPWRISTEHFEIRTNVPLNEAIAFGRRLEDFHQLFLSLFADLIGKERLPLAQRLASGKPAGKPIGPRHEVWYFADKSDYVDYFRRKFRRNESVSLGYYMPSGEARDFRTTPRSYFFRDEAGAIDAESTLYHEASHQVLFESAGPSRLDRNRGDFWVWEGLGTYFETIRRQADGAYLVGGRVGPRWEAARLRLIQRDEMIPVAELIGMGRDRFQGGDAATLHYVEAMALAVYLLNGEDARFRDGFMEYVRLAYDGRLGSDRTLERCVGISYDELDAGLRAFLGQSDVPAPR